MDTICIGSGQLWGMLAAAGGVALIICLVTVGFQAMRAAMADPVKSLKTE